MKPMTILAIGVVSAMLLCAGIGFESLVMSVYGAMGIGYTFGALTGCKEN